MKGKRILCFVLLLVGVLVVCYPPVSSFLNKKNGSYVIAEFKEKLNTTAQEDIAQQFQLAQAYNSSIQSGESEMDYASILNLGNGMMGYILIPSIDVSLPIFHGTEEAVLTKGVGHMPDSAFPIGGAGNHTVLTGHTGLPSAKLFTDLTELREEDYFTIHILDRSTMYMVDQIKVVLPGETRDLAPEAGKDYCTLVTCTPYGINSHRLLVRGVRVEDTVSKELESNNKKEVISFQTVCVLLAAVCALTIAAVICIFLVRKQKRFR